MSHAIIEIVDERRGRFMRDGDTLPDNAEAAGMAAAKLARIGPALQDFIDEAIIPCAQTLVFRRGRIVLEEVRGWNSLERHVPLQTDAIFRLYSMTKPVTAVAVLQLAEAGVIDLHVPLATYLPEFATLQVLEGGALVAALKPITAHHLLTHTAGLSYHFLLDDPVAERYLAAGLLDNWMVQSTGVSLADYVRTLASMPLRAQPGAAWCYSEAMNVLGRLVEVVSGQRFGDVVRERILAPLGMLDTDFYVHPESKGRLVDVYQPSEADGLMAISTALGFDRPPSADLGGSGLVGTAADYLRFARMLLNGGELDGVHVLANDSVRLLAANHLGPAFGECPLRAMPQGLYAESGVGHGYGGVVIVDPAARGVSGSAGEYSWAGAANTNFWVDFREELIVIVLSQVFPGESRGREIHEVVRSLVYDSLMERASA